MQKSVSRVLQEDVSTKELNAELERSLQRAQNVTEHERRRSLLVEIYTYHTKRVTAFCRNNKRRLIQVEVDDARAGHVLAAALG